MDFYGREVKSYQFLFELPNEDKLMLAKYMKFSDVKSWEAHLKSKLDWLSDNSEKQLNLLFPELSWQVAPFNEFYNDDFSTYMEKLDYELEEKYNSWEGNTVEFEALGALYLLKNNKEYFNLD